MGVAAGLSVRTVTTPRHTRTGKSHRLRLFAHGTQVVLCDDSVWPTLVQRLVREKAERTGQCRTLFYEFFTLLMAKDSRHLRAWRTGW